MDSMKRFLHFSILVLFSYLMKMFAQSPGGVHGTEVWFKTQAVSAINLGEGYEWVDYSGDSVVLYKKTNSGTENFVQSRSLIRTLNFYPALYFQKNDFLKQFNLSNTNLNQATILGVFAPQQFTDEEVILNIENSQNNQHLLTNCAWIYNTSDSIIYGSEKQDGFVIEDSVLDSLTWKESGVKILTIFHSKKPNISAWGNNNSSHISIGEVLDNNVAENGLLSSNSSFDGFCPELIIYNRILTPFERKRAESYLALKYGLTLNQSLYHGNGNLIWDFSIDSIFNNRISGCVVDNSSNLKQYVATTSYEEYPYYTWSLSDTSDCFFKNNSYNYTSPYRLLTIGREFGNTFFNDGEYFLWGDNDASALLPDTLSQITLNRIWQVRTNTFKRPAPYQGNVWNGYGISVVNKGECNYLIFEGATSNCYAVTKRFISNQGLISFTHKLGRDYSIGYTADTTYSSASFGYRFLPNGNIGKYINNPNNYSIIYQVNKTENIAIKLFKTGQIGLYVSSECVDILNVPSSTRLSFGVARIHPSTNYIYGIDNIRVSGTHDSGNFVELGFVSDDHKLHPQNNDAYLIIDRTGNSEIDFDNAEYIKATAFDEYRNKLIFNNVYWDSDQNGTDNFTFGCIDCLKQKILIKDATQYTDTSGNGEIAIKILAGIPPFGYYMIKGRNSTYSPILDDLNQCFTTDSIIINSIIPGDYTLWTFKIGGYEVYGEASNYGLDRCVITSNSVNSGSMFWIHNPSEVSNSDVYIAGFGSGTEVIYGFRLVGNKVYAVNSSSSRLVCTLHYPTQLSLIYSGGKLYYVCDKQICYQTNVSGNFYGVVNALSNKCQLYSLNFENLQTLVCSPGMFTNFEETCYVKEHITVSSVDTNIQIMHAPSSDENPVLDSHNFIVYQNTLEDNFVAKLYQDNPSPATLAVFDVSGKLIYTSEFTGLDRVRTLDFNVPIAGVYIVKALTYDSEFTQKIISRK